MPGSELDLAQERVRRDPWMVSVAARCCVRVSGRAAWPVVQRLLTKWPHPALVVEAVYQGTEMEDVLRPLGLQNQRAVGLLKDAECYLSLPYAEWLWTRPPYVRDSVVVAHHGVPGPVPSLDPYVSALAELLKEVAT